MLNKNIIIGVTAGIACYKILDLIKELSDHSIDVILTKNTLNLISEDEFKALGCNVYSELFNKELDYKDYIKNNKQINHISIADRADILVIAPATADIIGKIANGVGDDLLSTIAIAVKCPVLICPSMNSKMYENAIVQENIQKLRKLGYYFIDPEYGILACGYEGVGRLADLDKIKSEILSLIEKKESLKGKKVVVTAGGTSEPIDAVRVITNKSSGKMGIYIAEEASKRGAEVILLRGNTEIRPSGKIKDIRFSSSRDLFSKLRKIIKKQDIFIHAAAVSDFKVENLEKGKISSDKELSLKLKPTIKIIENLKKLNKKIKLIGFKAEYDVSEKELIKRARNLLKRSNADIVVANDVGKNPFGSETNQVSIVKKNRIKRIKEQGKRLIARLILDEII